jgi:hypothetical protein
LNGFVYAHDCDKVESGHLEVYDTDRYFTLTGDVYDGHTSVESRPTVVREIQDDYLPERRTFSFAGQQKPVSEQESDGGQTDATPEQVRRQVLRRRYNRREIGPEVPDFLR